MNIDDLYKKISDKLFNIFYVDSHKYGMQQDNGSYKLIKQKISPVTVEDMLKHQKSLLTYQELHIVDNAFIKWICIDLDIIKSEIDTNEVNIENLTAVKKTTDLLSDYLDSINIPHLVEFSGRRGFHIWIVFERNITKEEGYNLINYIYKNTRDKFEKNITADLFPKTPYVNKRSKGIGYGVKLPLSQNKVSNKLSFFLEKNESFEFNQDKLLKSPNMDFLKKQFEILSNFKPISYKLVSQYINEYANTYRNSISYIKNRRITSHLTNQIDLDSLMNSLKKCDNLNEILDNYEQGLSNKERSILVGLLGQLKTKDNNNFGRDLLIEIFSKIKDFNEEITLKKIDTLKYLKPISCKSLGKCTVCKECSIVSPIELIEGVKFEKLPDYHIQNIDEYVFDKIKKSLYQYSLKNDEVPLFSQLKIIQNINFENIKEFISCIYNGNFSFENRESFSFDRNETTKIRRLFNIDPLDNFVSIYFTFILNSIFFSEISGNSYGYEFSSSFYKNNIFNNWFINWAKYTRKIETILFNSEYEDYFLIKLDIKNFYDKINLNRLKIRLFEEAPTSIKEKLSELSEQDIIKYKNILDYLIDLSKTTTGDDLKGLPQGPAYARYLAELYLIGLDGLIENRFIQDQKREYYNRFVDDIFIFVESEERANNLFSKIKDWLVINDLEFNTKKTKIINVKKYAESGEYNKFKDNIKYDINFANKNKSVLPESDVQEALFKLENLTEEFKFGLKDNLRFFYSNFKDDKRLDFLKKSLAKRLPFTNDGRGTLYFIFYNNLISNFPDEFWNLKQDVAKIQGLSLTHFLNTILLNEDIIKYNKENINDIIEKVHSRSDLSDADQLLVTSLALKTNNQVKLNFSEKIMYSAIKVPDFELSIENWDLQNRALQDKTESISFLQELSRIINENTYTKEFLNKLATYSFSRFSLWEEKQETSFLKDESTLKLYYQALCFLTLFEISPQNAVIIESWRLLLNKSQEFGDISNKHHQFLWISKLENFKYEDFSNNMYTLILSDKSGTDLSEISCKNEFLKQYRNLVIMLLFSKDEINHYSRFNDDILVNIKEESLFIKWIKKPGASLYPEFDGIGLKNIGLNGIIVLKDAEKVFIKDINSSINFKKYGYLNIKLEDENTEELEYSIPNERLSSILEVKDFKDFILKVSELIKIHESFSKDYSTKYPVFYQPFNSFNSLPIIPFYSDQNEVIDYNGNIIKIEKSSYWESIKELIKNIDNNENIKLSSEESIFNFNITEIDKRFFPKLGSSIISREEDKLNFIEEFRENINLENFSIFEYQYSWSKTVFKQCEKLGTDVSNLISYLDVHFKHFEEDDRMDLFFSIDDSFKINDSNLQDFYLTITTSVNIFQNQVQIKDINFEDVFANDYLNEIEIDGTNKKINLADLKKINITVDNLRDIFTNEPVYKLNLEGEIKEFNEIYFFNHVSKKFHLRDINDLRGLIRSNGGNFILIDNEDIFIYTLENELLKCFNRIKKRKDLHDKIFNTVDVSSQAINIEILKPLYPNNKNYNSIKHTYDNFTTRISLLQKLKSHYKITTDIENRIINWLSNLNEQSIEGSDLQTFMRRKGYGVPDLHKSVLMVLDKHLFISDDRITFIKEKVEELLSENENEDTIILSIKNPINDENGLKRLLEKCNLLDRKIDWEKNFDKLCSEKKVYKKIVFVTDIALSGSQTIKAFNYYRKSHDSNELLREYNNAQISSKSPKKERYFLFDDIDKISIFNDNLNNCEHIVFVSSIMTELYKEKVKVNLADTNEKIDFLTYPNFVGKEFIYEGINYNNNHKELFETLVKDIALIKKLFIINEKDVVYYKKSIDDLNNNNVVLRINSLPAKHIKLFTLQPSKGKPLLEIIRNW